MKFKTLLFVGCFSVFSSAFADNRHVHPQVNSPVAKLVAKNVMAPGYCQIEVINTSYEEDMRVSGVFDDGTSMAPFNLYRYEGPHYIDLFYYGYCHTGMSLYIDTFSGYRVYSGYSYIHSTVNVVPVGFLFAKKLKVEIRAK